MKVKLENQEKSTIELNVTVPNKEVKQAYTETLDEVVKNADLPGFRKGQAPKKLVEEKTDTSELHGKVVNRLLQKFYPQALKENEISPISNPRVKVDEFGLDKDFEFTATVATRPEVEIGDYMNELENLYENEKEKFEKENEDNDAHYHFPTNVLIEKLVDLADFEVSDILVDEEVNRMFSQMIQQVQAAGMSFEDYLKSQDTTIEKIKDQYQESAERNIKAEFILSHLVQKEEIKVEENEVDAMVQASGNEELQEQMDSPVQRNYIRSIIAKNKLIQKLVKEIEGDNYHEHHHHHEEDVDEEVEEDNKNGS